MVNIEGWFSDTGVAVTSGQDHTQQSVTLQADYTGLGSWVTYQYRVGTTAAFVKVPTGDVTDASGSHPGSWPVQVSGSAFPADTWNIFHTLGGPAASVPDTLVQVLACYGATATDTALACGPPQSIEFDRSTFGAGYATEQVGPGTLALLSGDFEIGATDAAATTSLAGLGVGRSLTTLAPSAQSSGASGVFGPGWSADLSSPDAGDASLAVSDHASGGYVVFSDVDGAAEMYQATSALSAYPVRYSPVGDAAGNGETVTKTDAGTITMTDPDGTVTIWTGSGSTWQVKTVTEPGSNSNSTSTYTYNAAGLVTRILAPVPDGVSCASPDTTPACRSLILDYEPLTVSGSSVTRLQNVQLSIPQSAGTANKITVAAYDFTVTAKAPVASGCAVASG